MKAALTVLSMLYAYFSYLMVDEELHSAWSHLFNRCTASRPSDYFCIQKKQGGEKVNGFSAHEESHHSADSDFLNGHSVNSISDQKMLLTAYDSSNNTGNRRSDYIIEMSLFNGQRHGDVQ